MTVVNNVMSNILSMAHLKNILVVDDDAITIMIVSKMAVIAGFSEHVSSSLNGLEAKHFLIEKSLNFPDDLPEMILMDLQMGVMSGWEFLDWFTSWQSDVIRKPPIYIFSSSLNWEDEKKAMTYNAVKGFIIKPLTYDILVKIATEIKQLEK